MVVGISCGKDITATGPGVLKVRLTSPHSGADSAMVFTIAGPPGSALTSAAAGSGLRVFHQPLGGNTTRFALTGLLTNGATILAIGVPDVSELTQYSGTVEGVSQPNYRVRLLVEGYALEITR
jgi:hypothetical protein